MKKLRLLLFEDCDKNCSYCCNKQYDLANLRECTDFTGYDEIILTGGEPLLKPELVLKVIANIKEQNIDSEIKPKIYLYTSQINRHIRFLEKIIKSVDGITYSLHSKDDVYDFIFLIEKVDFQNKSIRVNAVDKIYMDFVFPNYYKLFKQNAVIKRITILKECPVPENEVFMRLPKSEKEQCPICGGDLEYFEYAENSVYAEFKCFDCDEDFTKDDLLGNKEEEG